MCHLLSHLLRLSTRSIIESRALYLFIDGILMGLLFVSCCTCYNRVSSFWYLLLICLCHLSNLIDNWAYTDNLGSLNALSVPLLDDGSSVTTSAFTTNLTTPVSIKCNILSGESSSKQTTFDGPTASMGSVRLPNYNFTATMGSVRLPNREVIVPLLRYVRASGLTLLIPVRFPLCYCMGNSPTV